MTSARLVLRAEIGTLLEVFDYRSVRVAAAASALEVELALGLYRVVASAGAGSIERFYDLSSGVRHDRFDPLVLGGASLTGRLAEVAQVESRQVHHQLGSGAELCILVTVDPSVSLETPPRHPWSELKLYSEGGQPLNIPQGAWQVDYSGSIPWAAINIEVNPAQYRLRIGRRVGRTPVGSAPSGMTARTRETVEQSVWVGRGWQTIVVLRRRAEHRKTKPDLLIDPAATAMHTIRRGQFLASSDLARRAEMARVALESNDVVVADALSRAVEAEREPLTALMLSLLLMTSPGTEARAREIMQSFPTELRTHPDWVAIAAALAAREAPLRHRALVRQPPTLAGAYAAAVEASHQWSGLIPGRSLASAISDRLFAAGIWLAWLPRGMAARTTPQELQPEGRTGVFQQLRQLGQRWVSEQPASPALSHDDRMKFRDDATGLVAVFRRWVDQETDQLAVPISSTLQDVSGGDAALSPVEAALVTALLRLDLQADSAQFIAKPEAVAKLLGLPTLSVVQLVAEASLRLVADPWLRPPRPRST